MIEYTGQEIFTQILVLLGFSEHPRLENAITIPCLMPYMTSQFSTRSSGDRPQVIPKGSINSALLGQYVEIPRDVVGTVDIASARLK
jgi:oleate hydratase